MASSSSDCHEQLLAVFVGGICLEFWCFVNKIVTNVWFVAEGGKSSTGFSSYAGETRRWLDGIASWVQMPQNGGFVVSL